MEEMVFLQFLEKKKKKKKKKKKSLSFKANSATALPSSPKLKSASPADFAIQNQKKLKCAKSALSLPTSTEVGNDFRRICHEQYFI